MRQRGMDLLISLKPEHSFYLSGFNPIIYSHPVVAVLRVDGKPTLLVHALRDDHARNSSWVNDIRLYGKWSSKRTMGMSWLEALREIVLESGCSGGGVIGIEEDFLPVALFRRFQTTFREASLVDCSEMIRAARIIKDQDEIEHLRIAADLADWGMQAALASLATGGSERKVAVEAMAAMNRKWESDYPDVETCDFGSLEGGAQNNLWCWCLTGDRVAYNCDNPTPRVPVTGELAVVFIWTGANGIHAEIERAVAVGEINDEKRAAYEAILAIRAKTQECIRPGITFADLYAIARNEYVRLGYAPYLPGRIGHGMGLGCHEEPSIGPDNHQVIRPGMVMTFEPNLRIPEWGGLQHSDTILVTEEGFEFITRFPRGFLQV
jgi:Xaa-Pro dipeptidase